MKKEMKVLGIVLLSVMFISLIAGIVTAQTNYDLLKENIKDLLNQLKLNPYYTTIILLGLLLFIIIFTIVKQIFGYEKGRWGYFASTIISLIIVILTFMFVPKSFIEAIALQYTAMGAAILTIVPFAIMLYFTLNVVNNLLLARITWLFYIMYYFVIFLYKILSDTGGFWAAAFKADNLPYTGAIIVGLFVFVFLKDMRTMISKGKLEAGVESAEKGIMLRKATRKALEKEGESLGLPPTR